jgi:hypothetical protein
MIKMVVYLGVLEDTAELEIWFLIIVSIECGIKGRE